MMVGSHRKMQGEQIMKAILHRSIRDEEDGWEDEGPHKEHALNLPIRSSCISGKANKEHETMENTKTEAMEKERL